MFFFWGGISSLDCGLARVEGSWLTGGVLGLESFMFVVLPSEDTEKVEEQSLLLECGCSGQSKGQKTPEPQALSPTP